MARDLYGELGVGRDATDEEITAGYRRAAKRAHPDAGGSEEEFARLSTARSVLLDPRARSHYDKTGSIEEPEPDNGEAHVRSVAVSAVYKAADALVKRGVRVNEVDVLAFAVSAVEDDVVDIERKIRRATKDAADIREFAARFGAQEGKQNRLGRAIEARAAEVERGIAAEREKLDTFKRALELLAEHTFRCDEPLSEVGVAQQFGQQVYRSGGW